MTTIWIDPAELDAAAGALAEQALRVQETMTGTRTTCTCEVPRSLVGWLDAELQAITVSALEVALGYLQQAVDIHHLAAQVVAEQSLVSTQAVVPTPDLAALISAGVPGGLSLVIGGAPGIVDSGPSTGGMSLVIGGAPGIVDSGPSTGGVPLVIGGGPSIATGGSSWNDVFDAIGAVGSGGGGASIGGGGPDMTGFMRGLDGPGMTWAGPPGISFEGGMRVDQGGNRSSSLTPNYYGNDGLGRY